LLAALIPVLLRLSILPVLPIPGPEYHDEFSYLLGSETFASGRLTNPTHPMWVHFETFHVNNQPTYATKYPPAQPLFLALGEKVLGHPWYGVLLTVGLMCAAICWMLQGWLPPSFALPGALLVGLEFGVAGYWGNSYWGGAIPAAAGALILGSLPRFVRRPTVWPSLLSGAGIILLANTRPFEGLILTVASGLALLWWRKRAGRSLRSLFTKQIVLPAAIILCAGASGMAYYNYRVTGSAMTLPYMVHEKAYAASPRFWFLQAGPVPSYRHEVIRKLWAEWERGGYFEVRANPLTLVKDTLGVIIFSRPFPIRLSILIGIVLARTLKVRIAVFIATSVAFALVLQKGVLPHYFAPALGAITFLFLMGVRYVFRMARQQSSALRKVTLVLFMGAFFLGFTQRTVFPIVFAPKQEFAEARREVVDRLTREGSRHLVIVRYAASHYIHHEWVQNHADIDGSAVIWARDMGAAANRELVDYYPERKVWLLQPDLVPPRLDKY
jgi:hypothetical protein